MKNFLRGKIHICRIANKKGALGEAPFLYMVISILKGRKYETLLGEIVHTGRIPPAC